MSKSANAVKPATLFMDLRGAQPMAELLGFEKVSHILRRGMAHLVFRRVRLLELAVVHYGNTIRQRDPVG